MTYKTQDGAITKSVDVHGSHYVNLNLSGKVAKNLTSNPSKVTADIRTQFPVANYIVDSSKPYTFVGQNKTNQQEYPFLNAMNLAQLYCIPYDDWVLHFDIEFNQTSVGQWQVNFSNQPWSIATEDDYIFTPTIGKRHVVIRFKKGTNWIGATGADRFQFRLDNVPPETQGVVSNFMLEPGTVEHPYVNSTEEYGYPSGQPNLVIRTGALPKSWIDTNAGGSFITNSDINGGFLMKDSIAVNAGETYTTWQSATPTTADKFRYVVKDDNGLMLQTAVLNEKVNEFTIPAKGTKLYISYPVTGIVKLIKGTKAAMDDWRPSFKDYSLDKYTYQPNLEISQSGYSTLQGTSTEPLHIESKLYGLPATANFEFDILTAVRNAYPGYFTGKVVADQVALLKTMMLDGVNQMFTAVGSGLLNTDMKTKANFARILYGKENQSVLGSSAVNETANQVGSTYYVGNTVNNHIDSNGILTAKITTRKNDTLAYVSDGVTPATLDITAFSIGVPITPPKNTSGKPMTVTITAQ